MTRFLLITIITFTFFSCKKEISNEFVPDPGNPYNDTAWTTTVSPAAPVNEIFQLFSKPSQTNSLNVSEGGAVDFDDDVQIIFPAKACGENVTGNIQIAIDHLKTKGDLIRFGKPTMSGDKLLVSAGAFNVRVLQNTSVLSLKDNKSIIIRYRAPHPDPGMKVFYGDTSVNSREGFTWVEANDGISSVRTTPSTSDTAYFYELVCKKLEWVNCDKFFNEGGDRTKVSVILPVNFTNKNTAVFLVSKDQFMVARCSADEENRLFFLENMPVGKAFTIVSISKIGSDLYLATKNITISKNLNAELSPEKKAEQTIADFLDSL